MNQAPARASFANAGPGDCHARAQVRLIGNNRDYATARDPTHLIRAALPEVSALMSQAFDEVGGAPVSGSELDQAGLADGPAIVEDYLAHGEAELALHHLIYMVEEPALPISAGTYNLIAEAGEIVNMDRARWERIRPTAPSD